ncbi:SUMF1/EgtB/PvdO family nonheme iron enzyme [Botrimarina sp.]|uniref:formylglycine-generating enzyme family protein n=1 Tax=Botrimarina sp. TaxID=2795802 RepID=UPI0032EACC61
MLVNLLSACLLFAAAAAAADPGLVDQPPADAGRADSDRAVPTDRGWMVPYTQTIPGTDARFRMVPVPGGVARLPVHADGEPAAYCEVELPPFWIGECEVTWAEYKQYMALDSQYARLQQLATLGKEAADELREMPNLARELSRSRTAPTDQMGVDAVTAPTPLYDPSTTYESGEDPRLPAVTMTPFAARQYTKWLSALTGHTYRLPSEAEWLWAAAAGEGVDFQAEGDADALDAVAWHTDNSDWVAHEVGEKEPNAWGLHDTLGNVAELVLDAQHEAGRPDLAGKRVAWAEGIAWPRDDAPRIAKGGWYDADPTKVTLAARTLTDFDEWRSSDPNLPLSPWWFSDYPATGVGFRVVRMLGPLPEDLQSRVWNAEDESVARDVDERLREGRGKLGPIGESLPQVVEELQSPTVRKLLE